GKFTVDLLDPIGSVSRNLASGADFFAGVGGGLLGAVGSIGTEEANLGDIPEAIGNIGIGVAGTIGEAGIPGGPLVKDVVGAGGDVLQAGQQAVEGEVAKQRLRDAQGEGFNPGDLPAEFA